MPNTLTLQGASLSVGPAAASGCAMPSGSKQFMPAIDAKPSPVDASGVMNVNSPSSFVTVPGIGTGGNVTTCDTFYMDGSAAMKVRFTFSDASTAVLDTDGNVGPIEFNPGNLVTKIEVQGVGIVEYLATGPA